MKPGDRVRMKEELKLALRKNGCSNHAREFGNRVGVIESRSDDFEPRSWDVRWQPSNLRYGYLEEHLEKVE